MSRQFVHGSPVVAAGPRPTSLFPEGDTVGEGRWQGLAQLVMCLCKPVAGIEPTGNMVKQPAKFTVDTISAGQGDLMVFVEDPEGNKEEVCWRMLRPLSASHGACHRARDSASMFLIKPHSKHCFLREASPGLQWLKLICSRTVP